MKQCIDRVLEQFEPLKGYFRESVFEDSSHTTEQILLALNNSYTLVYLEFLSYVLGLTNEFNLLFQSEKTLLRRLKFETEKLLKHLCSNYMPLNFMKGKNIFSIDHRNPRNFVPLDKIYLGINASRTLNSLTNADNNEKEVVLKGCLNFYIVS